MENHDEMERLKAELAASKREIKSLTGKVERLRAKASRQRAELKKKETVSIELSEGQLRSLSSRLPGIDIRSLLSD